MAQRVSIDGKSASELAKMAAGPLPASPSKPTTMYNKMTEKAAC